MFVLPYSQNFQMLKIHEISKFIWHRSYRVCLQITKTSKNYPIVKLIGGIAVSPVKYPISDGNLVMPFEFIFQSGVKGGFLMNFE